MHQGHSIIGCSEFVMDCDLIVIDQRRLSFSSYNIQVLIFSSVSLSSCGERVFIPSLQCCWPSTIALRGSLKPCFNIVINLFLLTTATTEVRQKNQQKNNGTSITMIPLGLFNLNGFRP